MRILYAVSLFSGLELAIQRGVWQPTGAPTIYRILEALDAGDDHLEIAFCRKSGGEGRDGGQPPHVSLDGLRRRVWVLPDYGAWLPRRLGLARLWREWRQALFLLRLHRRKRFDLCYFNNGNLLIAALFAYLRRGTVVLRIMGAYPWMKELAERRKSPAAWIEYMAYGAPYSYAVNSQDGSGGEWFMEQVLRRDVPRATLLNGVDRIDEGHADRVSAKKHLGIDSSRPLVLFVGKMEPAKGCGEFLQAILALARQRPGSFQAVMIGRGPLLEDLKRRVTEEGARTDIRFIPAVPHRTIHEWHQAADVYVSLNKLGSLSNANLEAMRSGACMIMLKSDRVAHVDEETDRLLSDAYVVRISREETVKELTVELARLLDDPGRRREMREKLRTWAATGISSWDRRVEEELRLLRGVLAS